MVPSHLYMRSQAAADLNGGRDAPDTVDLVNRAATGDRDAFRRLVQRFYQSIYRWAFMSVGDADEAEDVTQVVLIKVLEKLPSYRNESRFSTWLYVLTRNVILENARCRTRREILLAKEQRLAIVDQESETEEFDNEKLVASIRTLLMELPQRQREIFQLSDLDGFSSQEIATMLELEPVTVRTNLLKARRALRTRLLRQQGKLIEEYKA